MVIFVVAAVHLIPQLSVRQQQNRQSTISSLLSYRCLTRLQNSQLSSTDQQDDRIICSIMATCGSPSRTILPRNFSDAISNVRIDPDFCSAANSVPAYDVIPVSHHIRLEQCRQSEFCTVLQ